MITKEKNEYLDKFSEYLKTIVSDSEWYTYTVYARILADGSLNFSNEYLVKGLPPKYPFPPPESIVLRILKLDKERASLIYDWDKVLPENRARYEEIQKELLEFDEWWTKKCTQM